MINMILLSVAIILAIVLYNLIYERTKQAKQHKWMSDCYRESMRNLEVEKTGRMKGGRL